MANIREIQGRIKSIQDTKKITSAMYMISSTKLQKARKNLEQTEPYFYTIQAMIERIVRHLPELQNQYFDTRPEKTEEEKVRAFLVMTADKGLAGAYNHNVLKMTEEQLDLYQNTKLYVVGELGRQYFRHKHIPVEEQFLYSAQNPSLHRARVISERLLEQFKLGNIDEVYVIYTDMRNSVVTEPMMIQVLPVAKEDILTSEVVNAGIYGGTIDFDPSPEVVLDNIIPDYIMGFVYGALVESFCSEQSTRMMAMEAANKNANQMIHDLSIEYNRVRQAMITQEITEVIAGAKAQKKRKQAKKLAEARKAEAMAVSNANADA